MSKKLEAAQSRAEEAKSAAMAARDAVSTHTDSKTREKARFTAQRFELKSHKAAQRTSLLSKIENNDITKNEARRMEATRMRHQGYVFLKFFVTLGKKQNPCTVEENQITHG